MPRNIFAKRFLEKHLGMKLYRSISPEIRKKLGDSILLLAKKSYPKVDFQSFEQNRIRGNFGSYKVAAKRVHALVASRELKLQMNRRLSNRLKRRFMAMREPSCLVLSGGAFKGSFEVGFLYYIRPKWDEFNFETIIGTSVGAINALALSQEGKSGILTLIKLWLGLERNSDMFVQHPDLVSADHLLLETVGMTIDDLLEQNNFEDLKNTLLGQFADEAAVFSGGMTSVFAGAVAGGPIGLLLVGIGVTLAVSGVLSTTGNAGSISDKIKEAIEKIKDARGFYTFTPLRRKLLEELRVDGLGNPNNPKMRLAMVELNDGEVYYFGEDMCLYKGNAETGEKWDLSKALSNEDLKSMIVDATLASTSPPVIFEPIRLGALHNAGYVIKTGVFVDGGVREILPLKAAYDMGYSKIISILTSPPKLSEWKNEKQIPSVAEVAERILPILLDEIVETDLSEGDRRPKGISRFYPEQEVFKDSFNVDPGLIRINMAYGYMRAWLSTLEVFEKNLSGWHHIFAYMIIEAIIELRIEIWKHELVTYQFIPRPDGTFNLVCSPSNLSKLRDLKQELLEWVDMLYDIDPDALPIKLGEDDFSEPIQDWWLKFEKHQFKEPIFYDLLGNVNIFEPQIIPVSNTLSPFWTEHPNDVPPAPLSKHEALQ